MVNTSSNNSTIERERSVITKHLNNIFKEGELEPVYAKLAHTAKDGKQYTTQHYNLNVVYLSVIESNPNKVSQISPMGYAYAKTALSERLHPKSKAC